MKPAILSPAAQRDAASITRWYLGEGGAELAERFVAALDDGLDRVRRAPGAGAPRDLPPVDGQTVRGLRLRRFPYVILYIERDDTLDVVRMLHAARDMPRVIGDGDA